MLIATESTASFVVNGIISDENNSSFLNLKIYEAKRGSLIINQKISIMKIMVILSISLQTLRKIF